LLKLRRHNLCKAELCTAKLLNPPSQLCLFFNKYRSVNGSVLDFRGRVLLLVKLINAV